MQSTSAALGMFSKFVFTFVRDQAHTIALLAWFVRHPLGRPHAGAWAEGSPYD